MRKTQSLIRVLEVLLEDPQDQHWGYDLQKRARVRSGVLYPILRRLHDQGWVADGWEEPQEVDPGRPARRYYVLTPSGVTSASEVLLEAADDPRFEWLGRGAPA